ncbi:hypothetical protein SAMN05216559_2173 [Halomicrobium zhouii]|uniref:Uncharacterized protein n=1 Tax=Halomicrobium zhouii TaxID=767519 RepID=A0A1I6L6Y0_9EURY|nr:hypothetical protein [Halomicrobium zhouii]SFR99226.1 hypothetical protein SAMN05216559_2173 [Halomicrobium zhouii]
MPGPDDDSRPTPPSDPEPDDIIVSCERCDREWDLSDELATVGNQAFEQFALDHRRHTGHFPDSIETWRTSCRNCPEEAERLDEDAAHRWAATHARHTRHDVEIRHATADEVSVIEGEK